MNRVELIGQIVPGRIRFGRTSEGVDAASFFLDVDGDVEVKVNLYGDRVAGFSHLIDDNQELAVKGKLMNRYRKRRCELEVEGVDLRVLDSQPAAA